MQDLNSIYFDNPGELPEVTSFIHSQAKSCGFPLHILRGSFLGALTPFTDTRQVKAIFMGQRRIDPAGPSLSLVCPTDTGWPMLDRVNPILEWSYSQVWSFLRDNSLP